MSFEDEYDDYNLCHFPCVITPVIAPVWADLDFRFEGLIYYRSSQDPDILDRVGGMITDVNPRLSDYTPTLAVVVTWFDAMLTREVSSIANCPATKPLVETKYTKFKCPIFCDQIQRKSLFQDLKTSTLTKHVCHRGKLSSTTTLHKINVSYSYILFYRNTQMQTHWILFSSLYPLMAMFPLLPSYISTQLQFSRSLMTTKNL